MKPSAYMHLKLLGEFLTLQSSRYDEIKVYLEKPFLLFKNCTSISSTALSFHKNLRHMYTIKRMTALLGMCVCVCGGGGGVPTPTPTSSTDGSIVSEWRLEKWS